MEDTLKNAEGQKTIVVLGDWFLDENWLVAKHESYSSSHPGNIHYITKHERTSQRMISLCGASELMAVLKKYFGDEKPSPYNFLGFGAWNTDDNDLLQCLLCPKQIAHEYLTPFRIKGLSNIKREENTGEPTCPYRRDDNDRKPDEQIPCNMNDLNLINLVTKEGAECSTNRIIRCYEGYGRGRPDLLYRFDWQLPLPESLLNYSTFDQLQGLDIAAVIIEDHGKGVVQEQSIKELIKRIKPTGGSAKWYVRSKIDWPRWMEIMHEAKITARLTVVDYRLAEYWHGQRRWRLGGELGRASLEILGDLTGEHVYRHGNAVSPRHKWKSERAVALFDDYCISKDSDNVQLHNAPGPKQLINVGRTTMLFNALIAQDLSPTLSTKPFFEHCDKALQIAYRWTQEASKAWNQEAPHFYGDYSSALDDLGNRDNPAKDPDGGDYKDLWTKWNESSKDLGCIKGADGHERLELWRGMGALRKYICVGGPKRDALNELLDKIARFNDQKNFRYPFNCLLVSSPGWGKSYLAKCLAQHFDMAYLEFSLSQMANAKDLINCFDTICSVQNMTDRRLLIFMDEINCEIQGHSAMGLLLSPIWDGSFIREGKMYRISPAVWVFASTASIAHLVKNNNKGSDFVSRLNGPIIQLDKIATDIDEILDIFNKFRGDPSPDSEDVLDIFTHFRRALATNLDDGGDQLYRMFQAIKGVFRTDQVYLGVSLLNALWGPINKIQKDVLQLFHDVLLINGHRSLEFFVSKFNNIQRGVVLASNVPSLTQFPELRRHVVLPPIWKSNQRPKDPVAEADFIEIEIEPVAH